ncbi:hypothetical protein IKQ21_07250 [bacterium]|nr:hypothetical protein [bacterium]
MPVMKVYPTRIMMEPIEKKLPKSKMIKRSIAFPATGVLSGVILHDFGGPAPNEVPEKINFKEAAKKGAAGAAGGALVGALIGSFIPFVGTAIGAWAGAGLAGAFGMTAGAATEEKSDKK